MGKATVFLCVFLFILGIFLGPILFPTIMVTPIEEGEIMGVYFSPKVSCEDQIIDWINRANSSFHILIYVFTSNPIREALVNAHSRNVEIQIGFESREINKIGSEYYTLVNSGIKARTDNNSQLMHNKILIIDGIIVITGSFNWSANIENSNNENLIVIKSNKIACENGLLDVETQELTPFTLDEMAFYSINAKFDLEAECLNWLGFLKQVLSPEDILTLQEWSGHLLLPDYRFHKLMWLHGEGRNGKGVWQRTMEAILGEDNVSGVGLEEFDGSHRFALQKLYSKLFNVCNEPNTNRILQTALLKKATGQDTIDAEVKGNNNRIKFRNVAKITVIANKFPKINDTTTAFRERRLFIKFPIEFIGKDQIQNIEKKWLENPAERSGIINWMLEGLKRLLLQGYFTESKSQQETEIAFQRASDTIGAFQLELGIFDKNVLVTRSEAYNTYKEYCEFIGVEPENDKVFVQRMKTTPKVKDGRTTIEGKRERAWLGFCVKPLNDYETGTDGTYIYTSSNFQINQNTGKVSERVLSVPSVPTPYSENKKCINCADFRKANCRSDGWKKTRKLLHAEK